MQDSGSETVYTAICWYRTRMQVLQVVTRDPRTAQIQWLSEMRSHADGILPPDVIDEMEELFTNDVIEPVLIDNVASVWNCSSAVKGGFVDLMLVATSTV